MATILVLMARPGTDALGPEVAADAFRRVGARRPVVWLAEREACEAELCASDGFDVQAAETSLRTSLAGMPIDVGCVPAAGRRKRLLVADMDSTIIGQECVDELGAMCGRGAEIAAITERAMRGELNFVEALRARVAMLAGADAAIIDRLKAERITLTAGARTVVQTMKASGAGTVLVSGGFVQFTEWVAERAGFDAHRANRLLVEGGRFSGKVGEPVLGRAAKIETLREHCARLGIPPSAALAVGDGANDIDMLREAGLGVAFHAKPKVREAADVRIDHGDLTALLYLQGYARNQFVD